MKVLLAGCGGFLGSIARAAIPEGLATLEKVQIRLYRSGQIPKRRT